MQFGGDRLISIASAQMPGQRSLRILKFQNDVLKTLSSFTDRRQLVKILNGLNFFKGVVLLNFSD